MSGESNQASPTAPAELPARAGDYRRFVSDRVAAKEGWDLSSDNAEIAHDQVCAGAETFRYSLVIYG